MNITVQYFDDCPNWRLADQRLREALRKAGDSGPRVTYEKIETPEQAEEAGFRGSPTILVEGRDPFPHEDAPVGLSCRVYHTDAGPDGAPSLAQLAVALRPMKTKAPLRAHPVVLGAVAMATCCAAPVLVGVAGAVGTGAAPGAWGLLAAVGGVAGVFLARRLRGGHSEERLASDARPGPLNRPRA
jgi:hypothetical protein